MSAVSVQIFCLSDAAAYTAMAEDFYNTTELSDKIPFGPELFFNLLLGLVENENVLVLSCKKEKQLIGIAAAAVYPCFFNTDKKIVNELWWWVDPKDRGSLAAKAMLDKIELWAKDKKADVLVMNALANDKQEKVALYYSRRGFSPMEFTYCKGLR